MNRLAAILVSLLMGILMGIALIPTCASAASDDLLAGIPAPPNSKSLGTGPISSDGQHASYSTSASAAAVIASYQEALPGAGWTVTGSGGSGSAYGGGAGLQATNGPKYLSISAGGPAGMTFVHVCVWPEQPSDDNCGDN